MLLLHATTGRHAPVWVGRGDHRAVGAGACGRSRMEAIKVDGEQGLVSVADAAKRLERSTEQVRRYLREGRLAGRRLGGQWFIESAALSAFLTTLREQESFLDKVKPAGPGPAGHNPLGAVIGIGRGGGSNVAEGKDAYRRAFWWRR